MRKQQRSLDMLLCDFRRGWDVVSMATTADSERVLASCAANSTAADPCHSWAFYYPDSLQARFAGRCFGRHDGVFRPVENIPRSRNHVCTAQSCKYPPPPQPPPPPPPPPAWPAVPVQAHAPVAFLGTVVGEDWEAVCNFQVVGVISSWCWQFSSPLNKNCTDQTDEEDYIIATSRMIKERCPHVATTMYLNSL